MNGIPQPLPSGPRRALIMAGGGLKVAFQAGVLQVWLEEARTRDGESLIFDQADAASGGVFNLAMWCQGLTGREIADQWRKLRPLRGVSLNWTRWLPIPISIFNYDRFRRRVLQDTWGLDWDRIRNTDRVATFNLFNVDRQEHLVRRAAQMDEAALVSAVTLPLWFPPVKLGDHRYIDAVFATNANLEQAIELGADELWVVWTESQRGSWRPGFTHGYFQMIEATSNSRIRAVLERIERNNAADGGRAGEFGRRIEVKWLSAEVPAHYLFNLTRASMEEAVARGVAEGRRWCQVHGLDVVITDPPTAGGRVSFRERMVGAFSFGIGDPELGAEEGAGNDTEVSIRLAVTVSDVDQFVLDQRHAAQLAGSITCDALGGRREVTDGILELLWDGGDPSRKWLSYRLHFSDADGNAITLFGLKNVVNDARVADLWSDTTTLFVHLYRGRFEEIMPRLSDLIGSGIVRIRLASFLHQLTTFRGTPGRQGGPARSVFRFGQFVVRQLWQVYGRPGGPEVLPQFEPPTGPAAAHPPAMPGSAAMVR